MRNISTSLALVLILSAYVHASDHTPDYTNQYNTQLNAYQERVFMEWAGCESVERGRNVLLDLYDYDLRGAWLEGVVFSEDNGHGSDKYKKPNHITFSDMSKYAGKDEHKAGYWQYDNNVLSYTPSKGSTYTRDELIEYFRKYEPDARLIFP